jgi:hypothetical protein
VTRCAGAFTDTAPAKLIAAGGARQLNTQHLTIGAPASAGRYRAAIKTRRVMADSSVRS